MFSNVHLDPKNCEFITVGSIDDLPPGERLFVEIDDLQIVVFNIGGEYYAAADLCSHDNAPLGDGNLDGYEVTCPRHGARFDVRSGEALTLPAVVGIPIYPVLVVKNDIQIGLPKLDQPDTSPQA